MIFSCFGRGLFSSVVPLQGLLVLHFWEMKKTFFRTDPILFLCCVSLFLATWCGCMSQAKLERGGWSNEREKVRWFLGESSSGC